MNSSRSLKTTYALKSTLTYISHVDKVKRIMVQMALLTYFGIGSHKSYSLHKAASQNYSARVKGA